MEANYETEVPLISPFIRYFLFRVNVSVQTGNKVQLDIFHKVSNTIRYNS